LKPMVSGLGWLNARLDRSCSCRIGPPCRRRHRRRSPEELLCCTLCSLVQIVFFGVTRPLLHKISYINKIIQQYNNDTRIDTGISKKLLYAWSISYVKTSIPARLGHRALILKSMSRQGRAAYGVFPPFLNCYRQ
jgi:hypothetical protein